MNLPKISGQTITVLLIITFLVSGKHALRNLICGQDISETARIKVSPNILVSRDGRFPHVETAIAANHMNPNHLLGGSITMSRSDIGPACKTYASFNGGLSWTDTIIPEQAEGGGVDPQVTFSKPLKIRSDITPSLYNRELMQYKSFPCYAADCCSELYSDRIYTSWIRFDENKARLYFSCSYDAGINWEKPRLVDASIPADADQFQPALAVSAQGIVGIFWFDTRNLKKGEYHAYFTCSLDGGENFLHPVRLTSRPSFRWTEDNMVFFPTAVKSSEEIMISAYSAAMRWGSGGDYIGMTADREGVFHPFWPDCSLGVFQIYTCRVEILSKAQSLKNMNRRQKDQARYTKEKVCINKMIDLIFDPTSYHSKFQELVIPVRLKNISGSTIYGPISIEIISVFPGWGAQFKEKAPVILNSMNMKKQIGAIFDYTPALCDLDTLKPGAITEAVPWRLKLRDPLLLPPIKLSVYGCLKKEQE